MKPETGGCSSTVFSCLSTNIDASLAKSYLYQVQVLCLVPRPCDEWPQHGRVFPVNSETWGGPVPSFPDFRNKFSMKS